MELRAIACGFGYRQVREPEAMSRAPSSRAATAPCDPSDGVDTDPADARNTGLLANSLYGSSISARPNTLPINADAMQTRGDQGTHTIDFQCPLACSQRCSFYT
jgi:hypothetical protein